MDTNSERLRDRLVEDWWQARRAGDEVLMVATSPGERRGSQRRRVAVGDREVWLPAGYTARELRHGWAVTVHKAQGATVDRVFVVVDDSVTLESGYTALTRGRFGNHLYVHHGDAVRFGFAELDVHHATGDDRDPLEVLAGRLARSGAKRSALDHLAAR